MYAFIGGTPASGKSYLAKKFVNDSGLDITVISMDDLWKEMIKDPKLKKWVNLFWNMDEKKHWESTNYEKHMKLLVEQAEAFFPSIIKKVDEVKAKGEYAIFEGVSLLPHLVKRHFDFPGLFLVSDDEDMLFKRLNENPRWSKNGDLQKLEATYFVQYETRFIREEAAKYGYKVFNDSVDAEEEFKGYFNL